MSSKLKKVLILDGVDKICGEKLKQAGIEVNIKAKLTKDELLGEINDHDALIVRSATKVTAEVLQHASRLRVVGRAGTGVDNIDVEAATRKGVLVMNTPGGNTLSAAEHTCGLICALSRSVPQACSSLKTGAWDRKKFLGNEISEKTLAIIGLGRIGKEVSDRMRSFGMKVIGYDPLVNPETAASWGIEFLPLVEIWPRADYITVHTPLIPQTKYMINEEIFKLCKSSVKFINVARGGIIEEKALLKALDNGICGGAALDVFEDEPPKDFKLIQHPKVICTPHLGANTHEAQKRVAVEIADQFIAMSEGRKLDGIVNAAALIDSGSEEARPWISLASCMGSVASKLINPERGIRLIVNLYGKHICNLWKLMAPSILKGFLQSMMNDVNLVNSSTLAREAEIEICVTNHSDSNKNALIKQPNSVELLIQKGNTKISLLGSVDGSNPALFGINDSLFPFGLVLDKNLIFFKVSKVHESFAPIADALKTVPLLALLSSSVSASDNWIVVRTEKRIENIPTIPQAHLITQISF